MAHAPLAKGPLTRSAAGLEATKSLFDKGKHDSVMKIKTHSKEEIRAMKRPQLRDLAKTIGVTTSGSDADVADRLIAKFEDMRKTDPDFMIVESFFYFAFKGFPERTDYNAAYNLIKEFVHDHFDDLDVFVDVIGANENLEMV